MLSNYKLQYQLPIAPIIVGEPGYVIPLQLTTNSIGDTGYNKAVIKINVSGPSGSNPIVVTDSSEFFESVNGFELTPEFSQDLNFNLKFDVSGDYSITIKVVDIENSESVIVEESKLFEVEISEEFYNAKIAVELAETNKLQSDVDNALALVNLLSNSDEKTQLIGRLNLVQEFIDEETAYQQQLTEATTAVVTAETSKLQSDVDTATSLVDALREADKLTLNNRLSIVQDYINEEIDYQQQLTEATSSVVTAETSKLQTDVDNARSLVNALREADKLTLNSRLDVVQNEINIEAGYEIQLQQANNAVELAEGSKLQSDVDTAIVLVNALRESDKNDLLNRLSVVQDYINGEIAYQQLLTQATAAVIIAENSKLQFDVDTAISLVATLRTADKSLLNNRLSIVQDYINVENQYQNQVSIATTAVELAETTKLQIDVDAAIVLVNQLREIDKDTLIARLTVVQEVINEEIAYQTLLAEAVVAVELAESSKLQVNVDNAKTLVDQLRESDKLTLNNRLDIVQNEINLAEQEVQYQQLLTNATTSVEAAESSKLQSDLDNARVLVNQLREADKLILNSRLNSLQDLINIENGNSEQIAIATAAVELAENSKLQADIDDAQILVDLLENGSVKYNLQLRINVVISYNTIKKEANEAIDAYELTMEAFNAGDIDAFTVAYANLDSKRIEAFNSFNLLQEGADKESLKNRYYVAENHQYAAYKLMLLGFTGEKYLEPVKIENVGGDEPYKITFKGILPGQASTAWLFYPEGYLRTKTGNMLYPNDMPEQITDKISVGSDSIFISNKYIKGGQFVIVLETSDEYYRFVFEISEDGSSIIKVNEQIVSGIQQPNEVWLVDRQLLIDKVSEAVQLITDHEVGLNIGDVSQETHDQLQLAIDEAIVVRDTIELLTIEEVKAATTLLQQAISAFSSNINLTNRETITDSINEANALISGTTIGDQVGQVTQIAMDNLVSEVANAIPVRNNVESTQTELDNANLALREKINEFKAAIVTPVSFANVKMEIYENAALTFFNDILKKKITT